MSKLRALTVLSLFAVLTFAARSVRADDDPATTLATASAATAQDDDDATLQPAEPDFRLINLPTTLRLPLYKGDFFLSHRFAGNLRRGSFSDQASHLFGIDDGATIGFEYRFAVAKHLELAAYRTNFARTIQAYAKYDAIHQPSTPLSLSVIASVEGTDNLQENHSPAIGVVVSRLINEVAALYIVPTWVNNSAAGTGFDRDTTFFGVGGRLRFRPTVYLVAEVSPRLSGFAPGQALYGFAIEKRSGGHMFQLNFTNGLGTTLVQIARGGQRDQLALGFNISRKFY